MSFEFRQNGALQSLCFNNVEFAMPSEKCDIFLIQLRDFIGNDLQLVPADFNRVDSENGSFIFSSCSKLAGTEVRFSVNSTQENELRWKIQVTCTNESFRVEWIDFPRIRLRRLPDAKFLLPFAEGTLVESLDNLDMGAEFRSAYAEYPLTGLNSFYPGPAPMQFEAYYTGDGGLYIGVEDTTHAPKTIDARLIDGKNTIQLVIQHFTGGESAVNYDTVTAGFTGDWQDAALKYRTWVEKNDTAMPVKLQENMPEWFADSPVLLAYPIKGSGLDIGSVSTNEFYPYSNILPVVERYSSAWNCRIMALMMHWEGTAPWAPPYVWPPYGSEKEFREFVDTMHNSGNLVGLYCSGIGWTQKSMIEPSYDRSGQFEEQNIGRHICSGPKKGFFDGI